MTQEPENPASDRSAGSQMAVEMAREVLRAAHGAMIEAASVLEVAQAASERARSFVSAAVERRDEFRALDHSIAVDRSAEVKAALLAGRAPTFVDAPALSRAAAALREAESRADAAEIACRDIEAAENEAQIAMTKAKDEVRAAADLLVAAMASAVAEEIEALEGRAIRLRTELGGGTYAPVASAVRGTAMSPALMRVLASTDALEFMHNGPEDIAMRTAAKAWLRLIEELLTDPDAELRIDASGPVSLAAE